MKILVVALDCSVPELLLGEERLPNVRRLMSAGCFGRLESDVAPIANSASALSIDWTTIREEIARNGGRPILVGVPIDPNDSGTPDHADIVSMTRKSFAAARERLGHDDWTYFQLIETGLDRIQHGFGNDDGLSDYYQLLDEELGSLLAMIDDDTAVLIDSTPAAFVLAVPGQPARGMIEGARLIDLAPTLLELAGYEIPASMPGRSLVHAPGTHAPTQSEWFDFVDPSVEERLRGLGYLG